MIAQVLARVLAQGLAASVVAMAPVGARVLVLGQVYSYQFLLDNRQPQLQRVSSRLNKSAVACYTLCYAKSPFGQTPRAIQRYCTLSVRLERNHLGK